MIDNKLFVFKLHENEKFIIILEDDIKSIDPYSGCEIMFHKDNQQYQLYEEFPLNIFLLTLQTLIKKSLYNVLPLHESITQDIGFLWNQWLNEDAINLVYITDIVLTLQIGMNVGSFLMRYFLL